MDRILRHFDLLFFIAVIGVFAALWLSGCSSAPKKVMVKCSEVSDGYWFCQEP